MYSLTAHEAEAPPTPTPFHHATVVKHPQGGVASAQCIRFREVEQQRKSGRDREMKQTRKDVLDNWVLVALGEGSRLQICKYPKQTADFPLSPVPQHPHLYISVTVLPHSFSTPSAGLCLYSSVCTSYAHTWNTAQQCGEPAPRAPSGEAGGEGVQGHTLARGCFRRITLAAKSLCSQQTSQVKGHPVPSEGQLCGVHPHSTGCGCSRSANLCLSGAPTMECSHLISSYLKSNVLLLEGLSLQSQHS